MKKALVVGIIVLFIGVSVLPIVSSRRIPSPYEMLLEHGVKSKDNNEIEPSENLKEIITFIAGESYLYIDDDFFPFLHITCDGGHILMFAFSLNFIPIPIIATKLEANRFIGLLYPVANNWFSYIGIAFGNIEWE